MPRPVAAPGRGLGLGADTVPRRSRADRRAEEEADAPVLRQPHHALQRARFPRPLRGRRDGRLRGGRVSVPLCLSRRSSAEALSDRPDPGPAQSAGRQLGQGRARHRAPPRPRGRVPGRRRPGDRLCHGPGLQAGQLSGRHPARGCRAGASPPRRCVENLALRRAELARGRVFDS